MRSFIAWQGCPGARGKAQLYAATLVAAMWAHGAIAQPVGPEQTSRGHVDAAASDIKAYVLAPLRAKRPQWVRFGAVMGAVAFAYNFDDDVRAHFATPLLSEEPDMHDGSDAAPALLALGGTWLASALSDNVDGKREAGMMFQAAAFSSVAAFALKEIAGRERPFATDDRGSFGERGDAFPSMHVTAAFAIGTVLAESGNERIRWLRRVLGYGLAAGTAYARMDHDVHWLSDTVAGAGLGIATARFVMQRRDAHESRGRFGLEPSRYGVEFAYTLPLR